MSFLRSVPDPKEGGWTSDDDGKLVIEWMSGSPAPDAVLQLLTCKCAKSCKLPEYTSDQWPEVHRYVQTANPL